MADPPTVRPQLRPCGNRVDGNRTRGIAPIALRGKTAAVPRPFEMAMMITFSGIIQQ